MNSNNCPDDADVDVDACWLQIDAAQRSREQVKQLEHQREEEQLDRARVVNVLSQRLEESQQQCAKLLQTSECWAEGLKRRRAAAVTKIVSSLVPFRFSAGDDSDTNQTTAGSISQGTE